MFPKITATGLGGKRCQWLNIVNDPKEIIIQLKLITR